MVTQQPHEQRGKRRVEAQRGGVPEHAAPRGRRSPSPQVPSDEVGRPGAEQTAPRTLRHAPGRVGEEHAARRRGATASDPARSRSSPGSGRSERPRPRSAAASVPPSSSTETVANCAPPENAVNGHHDGRRLPDDARPRAPRRRSPSGMAGDGDGQHASDALGGTSLPANTKTTVARLLPLNLPFRWKHYRGSWAATSPSISSTASIPTYRPGTTCCTQADVDEWFAHVGLTRQRATEPRSFEHVRRSTPRFALSATGDPAGHRCRSRRLYTGARWRGPPCSPAGSPGPDPSTPSSLPPPTSSPTARSNGSRPAGIARGCFWTSAATAAAAGAPWKGVAPRSRSGRLTERRRRTAGHRPT